MKVRKSATIFIRVVGLAFVCAVATLATRRPRPRHAAELDPLWIGAKDGNSPPWCEYDDDYGSEIACGSPNLYKIADGASVYASYQPRVAIIRRMPTQTYDISCSASAFCIKAKALISPDPSWTVESITDNFFSATKSDKSGQPVLELFVTGDDSSTTATLYQPLARMPDWQLWIHRHLHI
jgi:hypothetical protein